MTSDKTLVIILITLNYMYELCSLCYYILTQPHSFHLGKLSTQLEVSNDVSSTVDTLESIVSLLLVFSVFSSRASVAALVALFFVHILVL